MFTARQRRGAVAVVGRVARPRCRAKRNVNTGQIYEFDDSLLLLYPTTIIIRLNFTFLTNVYLLSSKQIKFS